MPTTFTVSYGDPQTVEVNAKRDLGRVTAHWRSTAAAEQRAPTERVQGRRALRRAGRLLPQDARPTIDRHQAGRQGRGVVHGQAAQEVGAVRVHGRRVDKSGNVLLMVAEDYSGSCSLVAARPPRPGPQYLSDYETALARRRHRVRHLRRRCAGPHGAEPARRALALQGRHLVHGRRPIRARRQRSPAAPGELAESSFDDEVIEARDYMNEGGNGARHRPARAAGGMGAEPLQPARRHAAATPCCKSNHVVGKGNADDPLGQTTNCVIVSNDFHPVLAGGVDRRRSRRPTTRSRRCRSRAPAGRSAPRRSRSTAATRSDNQAQPAHVRDDRERAAGTFPQFNSSAGDRLDRPPAYDPPEGTKYAYAKSAAGLEAAAAHGRPDRQHHRRVEVQGLLQHRARLRLRVRGGAHRRPGRLDDAARQERAHGHQCRSRLVRHRLGHVHPFLQALPDQPDPGGRTARNTGRPACGTPQPATPTASTTGTST